MRMLLTAAAALVIGAVTAAPPAAAAPAPRTLALGTYLSGDQEVPKTPQSKGDPDASGVAMLQLHRNGKLCYVLRVRHVSGKVTAAHLHEARAGKNGPIRAPLALPVWAGSVASCTELGRRLTERLWRNPSRFYLNVHSVDHPDGAVRGQLHRG
jgi:hypothetical protein